MKAQYVPTGTEFRGTLELVNMWGSNRSIWRVVHSDNPAAMAGMTVRCSNTRIGRILEGKTIQHKLSLSPGGAIAISGKFKTRNLYNDRLTVPT